MVDNGQTEMAPAAILAARLRLLQSQLADHAPAERQAMLADEVERGLKSRPAGERAALAKSLVEVLGGNRAAASGSPVAVKQAEPTPADLADKLIAAVKKSPDQRAAVLAMLKEAGVTPEPVATSPVSVQATTAARKALGLPDSASVDPERLIEVALQYLDMCARLHAVMRQVWSANALYDGSAAGMQTLQRSGEYVSGQAKDNLRMLDELKQFRNLAVALVRALPVVPRHAADEVVSHFAPSAIESGSPRGGFLKDERNAAWEHYKTLWESMSVDSLETTFRERIVKVVAATRTPATGRAGAGSNG